MVRAQTNLSINVPLAHFHAKKPRLSPFEKWGLDISAMTPPVRVKILTFLLNLQ
jgi:hypothetical protein